MHLSISLYNMMIEVHLIFDSIHSLEIHFSLGGKWLIFYFCITFPLALWKAVLEIHNKIMKA